jgi:hypothetical protein
MKPTKRSRTACRITLLFGFVIGITEKSKDRKYFKRYLEDSIA